MLVVLFIMTRHYIHSHQKYKWAFFIRPSSDGTYYGMVMSVRPGLRPSVRHSFPHFSPTCFDILIWNFVYHFIFMHVRSSSNAINFRHFLQELCFFYTPVFRRDVLWYGDVRPSGSPSVRPSQFSALFFYMLWHIDLKFCVSLYFYARKIKFECHQFPSLFAGVMLLFNFKLLQICSFPHFSPTCFDILSSNFVYDFVWMYHRASLSVIILLQFFITAHIFFSFYFIWS